ncbi:MAG: hypothetical protein SCARUB_04896 [Candidatus Scalindua rubra]|uniref:Uncharacterized protein n=1 Tax=Candidatus Scalindua rubra TaxID=1872076 RepID=A0A1E3X2Z6_9BACT|nr:MAG: hypothetical protein SCARUB_04896 [Candidatus Scalindua rubra]
METFLNILSTKRTLYAVLLVAFAYEVLFGNGLGGLVVFVAVCFAGIGYILIPIVHAIYNLFRPENTLGVELVSRLNLSVIIGLILRVLIFS